MKHEGREAILKKKRTSKTSKQSIDGPAATSPKVKKVRKVRVGLARKNQKQRRSCAMFVEVDQPGKQVGRSQMTQHTAHAHLAHVF